MEPNYEVGKTYDLAYEGLTVLNNEPYITVTDGKHNYTLKPYDYQIEYSVFPKVVKCYVRKIGYTGAPYFEQLKEQALQDRFYQTDVNHEFTVSDVLIDSYTNKVFYILSDEYGIQHRYYPGDDETVKKSGDRITLLVKGILPSRDGKNNARLDLCLPGTDGKAAKSAAGPVYPRNAGKKHFGCENEKKEFKSSIVFPAGETGPNISKQLGIICRTMAGFMNAGGGTLYIGVSDNGYICGIESDFSHLNENDDDPHTYKGDDDGYSQVIMNSVVNLLGGYAGTLVHVNFKEDDGKKYCVIEIEKASRPIWFAGYKLFVRMITTNRKLQDDEITQYILDRVSKNSFAKQKNEEVPLPDRTPDAAAQDAPEATAPSVTVPAPAAPVLTPRPAKATKAWRHITLFDNGEWSFQKDELSGQDIVCNVVVPGDAKRLNLILILAYRDGHVDAVALKSMLYGKNGLLPEGKRRGGGLCLANDPLQSAFCANKKDMLLLRSEVAGEQFVKVLDVDTLGIHDRMSRGNEIIREQGAILVSAVHIPDDDGTRISLKGCGIFIDKGQKYTRGGVRLSAMATAYREMLDSFRDAC